MSEPGSDAVSKPRLGISACLLGQRVRYDGGHKRDRFLTDTLGHHFEWVPVCPEVECGLPIPREVMQLVGDPDAPRLLTLRTRRDLTDRMQTWIGEKLAELEGLGLVGFVFKSRSPSCGLFRPELHASSDPVAGVNRNGAGLFARAFAERFGALPVEDEIRLLDTDIRARFLARVAAAARDLNSSERS